MAYIISFDKTGHDRFIDFIKAYSILCVLFGHTCSNLSEVGYVFWAGMQVPLFILVQVFHVFKKEESKIDLCKIFKRVLLPFLIIQFVTSIGIYCLHSDWGVKGVIFNWVYYGGYGPGAYYPWVFIQFAVLLPLIHPYIKKIPKFKLFLLSLLICEGLEIICAIVNIPDSIYRILAIRYLFLVYFGYLWVKEGIVLNLTNCSFAMLSLACVFILEYYQSDFSPYLYNTIWHTHRWPCYFYVCYLLIPALHTIWQVLDKKRTMGKVLSLLAKCSYEIFLIQMMAIAVLVPILTESFALNTVWIMLLVFTISIVGGVFFNKIYSSLMY